MKPALAAGALLACTASLSGAQETAAPTFDVVSIRLNDAGARGARPPQERPDGGITLIGVPVTTLLARAYSGQFTRIDGLPDWATRERYDVSATAALTAPMPADRGAMICAMLADRFNLLAHLEDRPEDVFELRLAREDGRLGRGLAPSPNDCAALIAAGRIGAPPAGRPDSSVPPPTCTVRTVEGVLRGDPDGGAKTEGEATMTAFAAMLRPYAGRPVIDRTGLAGSYRVDFTFDFGGRTWAGTGYSAAKQRAVAVHGAAGAAGAEAGAGAGGHADAGDRSAGTADAELAARKRRAPLYGVPATSRCSRT